MPKSMNPLDRNHSRFLGLLLALALLPTLPLLAVLHAQDDGSARDKWQRPTEVMDALGVKPGSVVADVGAGGGYFTFHLAARVGPNGKVYAEDIAEDQLEKIRKRAAKEQLTQVETILGTASDPHLPENGLDAILVVNAYHEFLDYDAMMQGMFGALKPGGLLAILDARDEPGQPRKTYQQRHTLPPQIVQEDAARNGFQFLRELAGYHNPDRNHDFYFLLFSKPLRLTPPPVAQALPAFLRFVSPNLQPSGLSEASFRLCASIVSLRCFRHHSDLHL